MIVIIGILVIGFLFSLIYLSSVDVSSKTFSLSEPVSQGGGSNGPSNSLVISDVNGAVNIAPWSQSTVLINGTVTAKGLGTSPSAVGLTNSSTNGNIVFRAAFPNTASFFLSQSYTVNVDVFVPSTIRFSSVEATTENGGVRVTGLNATVASITTVNGLVSVNCLYCDNVTTSATNGSVSASFAALVNGGWYSMSTVNGDVTMTLPALASFKFTASTVNGSVQSPGLSVTILTQSANHLSGIVGTGSANVNLSTVNGQITITGK